MLIMIGFLNYSKIEDEEPPAKLREIITPPKESKDPGLASDGIPELFHERGVVGLDITLS